MVFPMHSWFILGLVFPLNQISVSRLWFFVHMRRFDIDILFFFFNFLSDFFRNGFSNSLILLGLVCCFVNKNSLNCTGLVLLITFLVLNTSRFSR